MGKTIEKILKNRGHVISGIVDVTNDLNIRDLKKLNTQVAIEFTTPDSAVNNIRECMDQGIPVISGTTGWMDKFEEVKNYCELKKGTFFYASNFSLGVNIFFKLNQYLAKMMGSVDGYQAEISETHHTQKLDKPSGTAITIAQGIIEENNEYNSWVSDEKGTDNTLPIWSFREPEVPGSHSVSYKSVLDEIVIRHTAKTREGFALGAVLIAEWISGKKGFLTMDDYLKF